MDEEMVGFSPLNKKLHVRVPSSVIEHLNLDKESVIVFLKNNKSEIVMRKGSVVVGEVGK